MIRLKKLLKAIIFVTIISVLFAATVYAATVGVVTVSSVNLRSKPSTSSAVLTALPKGTNVTITGTSDKWYSVEYKNYKGYVYKDYLKTTSSSTATTKTTTTSTGTVTGAKVNLREKASTSSKILTSLVKNTKVTITGEQGSFYKVTYGKYTGYMSKSYVSKTAAAAASTNLGNGVVTAAILNIRSAPSISSTTNIIATVKKGTSFLVLSKSGDWYKITYNKKTAYAYADYVSLSRSTQTSRGSIAYNDRVSASVVAYAKKFLGVRYVYGGASPSGFDCSGFTYYVFKNFNIDIPHGATSQSKLGISLTRSELQPGDLVFFSSSSYSTPIGHVGIYIGDGKFIHASSPGSDVKYDSLNSGYYKDHYAGARRIIR